MREAQRLRDADWSCTEIGRMLNVAPTTVACWTDPAYNERRRARGREAQRRRQAQLGWNFRFGGVAPTDEFKAAFIVRLRGEGVPPNSIAKVCCVVFAEPWSRHRVERVLRAQRQMVAA